MKKYLKKYIAYIVLGLVSLVLFFTNYKVGTFLVGWDNLYPEFNFKLDFYRNLYAVWQEYRGLGLIDGMSHAANLVHDAERFILSLILPMSLIRWTYIFMLHLLGGMGVYALINTINPINKKHSGFHINIYALLGALFYQYNLGTIQQFFLPFEVFIVHFGFLPWLIYWIIRYLESGNKRELLFFSLFSLASVPQAHVPTLFIVYIVSVLLIFLTRFLVDRKTNMKRIGIILLTIFVINAYWGLPFFYGTITNSNVITNSKNFQMTSNDIFSRNHKYGNFADVALIKGFSLDFNHYNYKTSINHYMMQPWLDHLRSPFFYIPAWLFFITAIIGWIVIIVTRNRKILPIAVLFIFAFFMMGTDVPIIGTISALLRTNVPFFSTIFRFVFTKFSIVYVLSYSILLAFGIEFISARIHKQSIVNILLLFVFLFMFSYTLPSFKQHFFYENLAVKIPDDYFQTFDFFNKQDHGSRIAILPIPWFWAWLQPTWGTINSGFIWYGIPQPITDLAFTPWSDKNENFYWELEQAIYSEDTELLNKVLHKYDITWIYLDTSISHDQAKRMTYDRYRNLFNQTQGITLAKQFGSIYLYKFSIGTTVSNFISLRNDLNNVGPSYGYDNYDVGFSQNGNYFTASEKPYNVYYPFRSLFSGKSPNNIEYTISEDERSIIFQSVISEKISGALFIPSFLDNEFTVVNNTDISNQRKISPQIYINDDLLIDGNNVSMFAGKNIPVSLSIGDRLKIIIEKQQNTLYRSIDDTTFISQTNDACEKKSTGMAKFSKKIGNGRYIFTLFSVGTKNCVKAALPFLYHQTGYLLNVQTTTDSNRGLFLNWYNETFGKSDIEIYFENDGEYHNYYFIIPPRQQYGLGYTAYFTNLSEGTEEVTNTLEGVSVYQIPYRFLKSLQIVQSVAQSGNTDSRTFVIGNIRKENIANYAVELTETNTISKKVEPQTLVLSQSYDEGWRAYQIQCQASGVKCQVINAFPFLFGEELKEHVLVNNWANGWLLNNETMKQFNNETIQIKIIYLPQYLEYVGFGLLFITAAVILFPRKH